MKTHTNKSASMIKALLLTAAATLCSATASATPLDVKLAKSFAEKKFSKDFKVRGWKIGPKVYFGQAKVAGKYGVGVVVDRDSYSWGVNNRGVAFLKKF